MNVGPVQASSGGVENPTPAKKVAVTASPAGSPVSENDPKAEAVSTQASSVSPAPFSTPEHEVKVQLDTPADGIIVYKIVDKISGGLVMQVPSAEQLRNIHQTQELVQEITSRGTASTSEAAAVAVA